MGKIVKYCSSCDEGFAERYGFCPNCAASLETFEMNPVTEEFKLQEENTTLFTEPDIKAAPPEVATETPVYDESEAKASEFLSGSEPEIEETAFVEPVKMNEVSAIPAAFTGSAFDQPFYQTNELNADEPHQPYTLPVYSKADDDYHITVIQEKNTGQRNILLLASTIFMTVVMVGGTVISLFTKDIGIGAIGDDQALARLIDEVPMDVEEEKVIKEKDKGGGGGGGGREEPEETSRGDLADQTEKPIRPPDAKVHRADFELVTPPPSTEGNRKFVKDYGKWGDPNSMNLGTSNGTGSGGGQGSGFGTGQGSGRGTGVSSGTGSGSGSGDGDGNGDGSGSGGNSGLRPPPPKPVGVTTAVKIISKPRATYTDAARTNNVQGNVTVKVTLLASGSIGSVTAVSRLPHGLTEQAIAAARQIKFEPKKINGVPQSTTVTMQYGFTIY